MTSAPPAPKQQQQKPQQNNTGNSGGRGGRGRGGNNNNNNRNNNHGGRGGGRGGGRTPSGGRTIYNANNTGGGGGRGRGGRGRGGGPSSQGDGVQKLAPNTGIPFGHVPAYLPGSSSLVEELDQRIMVVLRDGRHLVGNLRTFDQYSNMVLDCASERRFHDNNNGNDGKKTTYFTDVPLGMYIVRGDSIVLLGQIGSEEEETANTERSVVSMKKLDEEGFEAMVAGDNEVEDDDQAGDGEDAPEAAGKSKSLEWDFDKDLIA